MTLSNGVIKPPTRVSLTSVAIPVDVLELICKLKKRGETNGDVCKRVFLDWLDLREEKKDLEELLKWKDKILENKDKKISELENWLKDTPTFSFSSSPSTSIDTTTSTTNDIHNNNNNNNSKENVILKKIVESTGSPQLWSPQNSGKGEVRS